MSGEGAVRLVRTPLGTTVLLDRPARRNALTLGLWVELGRLVRELGDGAGPLYLCGAGGYFCSGADLDALRWAREAPEQADEFVTGVVQCLLTIHAVDREVVAVVEGGAAGGGVEIMAACDRRVVVGDATLVFPFGHHGMSLDDFTRWRLHRLVGPAAAERLVDGRHVVGVDEAARLGLVDERHATLEALVAAERARAAASGTDGREGVRSPGDRYLSGPDDLREAVSRAAAPMRLAFPPHR